MMTYVGPQQTWFLSFWLIQFVNFDYSDVFNGSVARSIIRFEVIMLIAVVFLVGILAFRDMMNQLDTLARKQYPDAYLEAK